ncbi:hypothetical protein CFC21_095945 [Triticum aestivum]|uniref:Uncharacterized protein n=3 Tax=Triticum TaxID=4564 RepID=A0A9R0Z2C9_TRITD|nr:hypothetical protein CFC21_095945 [Triticum aestivum]VAI70037.1 unnamed protein product [Triticum turgidum subsp. durum]
MATAPPPAPSLPPLPAGRRLASAVRSFPPCCGRQQGNAAQPPRRPAPVPSAANDPPPRNPYARAATKPSSPPAAARLPGAKGHDRGEADGPMAGTRAPAAAEVVTRRLSAVRRYPPGCGRVVAAPKPEAPVAVAREEDAGAIDLLAAVCDVEAEALAADRKADGSDGEGKGGGDGDGALAGCGSPGPPRDMAEIALVPWAQYGQRSQQRRKSFEGGL